MSDRPVDLLIDDILERIRRIGRYTGNLDHDAFVQDEKTVDAVVRNLGVIGEAARRVPQEFTERHPGILWRQIVGLRNRIVRDYLNVDGDPIWQIVRDELPRLESELARLKRREEPGPSDRGAETRARRDDASRGHPGRAPRQHGVRRQRVGRCPGHAAEWERLHG
jgi:hypothetical protein